MQWPGIVIVLRDGDLEHVSLSGTRQLPPSTYATSGPAPSGTRMWRLLGQMWDRTWLYEVDR